MTPTTSTGAAPAGDRSAVVVDGATGGGGALDIDVNGLVRIRLIGATAPDRRAVERQFGPARPAGPEAPNLQIRYVRGIPDPGVLRFLGPGEQGFTADGFYVLRGRFRQPVRVRLPLEEGGRNEVLCEHGVGRVPHLVALVNLAVLAAGGVALHASSFRVAGGALVATGWSKGGKTEALLAATRLGAGYIADEWAHLRPDGTVSGIREPVRLWDWHLAQLPELRAALPGAERGRLVALRAIHEVARAGRTSARVTSAIERHRHVDAPPELLDRRPHDTTPAPVRGIYLMTSADQSACTLHTIGSDEVADRMAASLAYERADLAGVMAAHRFAFPTVGTPSIEELERRERDRLRTLLASVPAVEVRHPHHVDLAELGRTLQRMGSWWS